MPSPEASVYFFNSRPIHEIWSYFFVHVYLQQPLEESMEVAVYYRDDQQDTHHNSRPKIKSNEITKLEDDASHMVGVIVIKPRGDLSESPLYIGQRTDENQCNSSIHSITRVVVMRYWRTPVMRRHAIGVTNTLVE